MLHSHQHTFLQRKATLQSARETHLGQSHLLAQLNAITLGTQLDPPVRALLDHWLGVADCTQVLDLSPLRDEPVHMYGLSPSFFKKTMMVDDDEQREIVLSQVEPLLVSMLQGQIQRLASFYFGESTPSSTRLAQAKGQQLPTVIESMLAGIDVEQTKSVNEIATAEAAEWELFDGLGKLLCALGAVVKEHQLGAQWKHHELEARWLRARCEAMLLKLRVVKAQVLRDTYTKASVDSLKSVQAQLRQRLIDVNKGVGKTFEQLRQYETVGLGFSAIVKEYASLREQIESKQWAIAQIRREFDEMRN